MVATVKEGDFVVVEFTGKYSDGKVFETTQSAEASKEKLQVSKPAFLVAGKGQVVKGFDNAIVGSVEGVEKTIKLSKDDAYGERNLALVRLVPLASFKKNGVQPYVGMDVELDNGMVAKVTAVESGRVKVDLNHPLAGHEVEYTFKVTKIASSPQEKAGIVGDTVFKHFDTKGLYANGEVRFAVGEKAPKLAPEFLQAKARAVQLLLQYVDEIKRVYFEEFYDKPKVEQK